MLYKYNKQGSLFESQMNLVEEKALELALPE